MIRFPRDVRPEALRFVPTLLAIFVALGGCTMRPAKGCPGGTAPKVQETLYFGRTMPDGEVSLADWERFVHEEVTPRFAAGLTTWPATGQWRSERGEIVRENTQVLVLLHEGGAESAAAVDAIARVYAQRFRQESVLRVTDAVCASF